MQEQEEIDWARAEDLIRTNVRADVELISSSTRGFVVSLSTIANNGSIFKTIFVHSLLTIVSHVQASFGSLIGFLPYRNLAAKWKFFAFESWLRKKGIDPSKYRQRLGIIGGNDASIKNPSFGSVQESGIDQSSGREVNENMSMEELLQIYDQEKIKFLSSFVGQVWRVNILLKLMPLLSENNKSLDAENKS